MCFDVTMKCDFDGPCQDAGKGFGFQEESEVVTLLNCESTSCSYSCQFGVPCDCNQGITATGQFPQTSSVDYVECVELDAGVCSASCGG